MATHNTERRPRSDMELSVSLPVRIVETVDSLAAQHTRGNRSEMMTQLLAYQLGMQEYIPSPWAGGGKGG